MLDQLRLFMTVVEEGSLHRAAERAHISQSAVTRQMQSLEHDLGGRILERTSTGVRPTTGGHVLAQKAKLLLEEYDSTMGDVRRLVRGESYALVTSLQPENNISALRSKRCAACTRK